MSVYLKVSATSIEQAAAIQRQLIYYDSEIIIDSAPDTSERIRNPLDAEESANLVQWVRKYRNLAEANKACKGGA